MAITVTRYEQNQEAYLLERLMQRPYPSPSTVGKAGVVRALQPFVFEGSPSREQQSAQRRPTEKASNIPLKDRARAGAGKKMVGAQVQERAGTPTGSRTAQRKAAHQLASSPPNAQGAAVPQYRKMAPATAAPTPPMKALHAQVLNNWAGPGFSLPPAPEQLPMPSASLLTSKRQ